MNLRLLALAWLCGLVFTTVSQAEDRPDSNASWRFCGQPLRAPADVVDDGTTRITADSAGGPIGTEVNFNGNVRVERGNQRLEAHDVVYRAAERHVTANGSVHYQDPSITVSGSTGELWLRSGRSRIVDTQFGLYSRNAHGAAKVTERKSSAVTQLERIYYTTCDAEDEDWRLNARTLSINHHEGFGTATHVWVEFMGVPIMYSPWASFPIDDRRKTGFLVPSLSSSKSDGVTLAVPWYWNIAPNQDATVTPRVITERGFLLETEYRYLWREHQGDFTVGYLPYDHIFGGDRERYTLNHSSRIGRQWQIDAQGDRVTDQQYLRDLGTRISVETTDYLEQRLDLSYRDRNSSGLLRAQTYQPLASELAGELRPYKRLPQLLWQRGEQYGNGLGYAVTAEAVNFQRDTGATGLRTDLLPKLSWRWGQGGYYLEPRLGYRYTAYALDDQAAIERALPITELNAGLIFERSGTLWGQAFSQTLEPQLYYVHIPYRDQAKIPMFDTSERELNYAQLFRDNRFSGADRVNDAQQLSVGVASRWYDELAGLPLFSAAAGQIYFLETPRLDTQLSSVHQGDYSDWVMQLTLQPSPTFGLNNTWLIDPDSGHTQSVRVQSHYAPGYRRVFNLGYTFQEHLREQAELAASWPVADRWQALGRIHHALDIGRTVETLLGLEYQSCCWSVRVLARNHRDGLDDDLSNNVMLQLELKGLTNVGSNIENVLQRGILGYE
jgi:LPS-assembly protein